MPVSRTAPAAKGKAKGKAKGEAKGKAKGRAKGEAKRRRTRKATPPRNATPAAAAGIYRELAALYPDAHCELNFQSPYQLLAATILSAQCTDKRVNMVTPELFRRFPSPSALAAAEPAEVEAIIRTTGFFRAKSKSLIGMARAITEQHGGEVPSTMEALVVLPGVGRKTANVILGNAFGIDAGVVVDTHVLRLAHRIGLTSETDPIKVEQDLMRLFPRDQWTMLSHLLIWHGRRTCDARKPRCGACALAGKCPSAVIPAGTTVTLQQAAR
ncbi:MAG: endonuclease III [Gemmatimonadaceae bacterium]|nr:endonuclease III [Gemmatimonadaceae bacterium]